MFKTFQKRNKVMRKSLSKHSGLSLSSPMRKSEILKSFYDYIGFLKSDANEKMNRHIATFSKIASVLDSTIGWLSRTFPAFGAPCQQVGSAGPLLSRNDFTSVFSGMGPIGYGAAKMISASTDQYAKSVMKKEWRRLFVREMETLDAFDHIRKFEPGQLRAFLIALNRAEYIEAGKNRGNAPTHPSGSPFFGPHTPSESLRVDTIEGKNEGGFFGASFEIRFMVSGVKTAACMTLHRLSSSEFRSRRLSLDVYHYSETDELSTLSGAGQNCIKGTSKYLKDFLLKSLIDGARKVPTPRFLEAFGEVDYSRPDEALESLVSKVPASWFLDEEMLGLYVDKCKESFAASDNVFGKITTLLIMVEDMSAKLELNDIAEVQ